MITPDLSNNIERFNEFKGAVKTVQLDLSLLEEKLGVTVSSATWAAENNRVTVGSASLASSVASAPVTMVHEGVSLVKITLETSGNDKIIIFLKFRVSDPFNQ